MKKRQRKKEEKNPSAAMWNVIFLFLIFQRSVSKNEAKKWKREIGRRRPADMGRSAKEECEEKKSKSSLERGFALTCARTCTLLHASARLFLCPESGG